MNWTSINIEINCLCTVLLLAFGSLGTNAQYLSIDEATKRACFVLTEQLGKKEVNPKSFSRVEKLERKGRVYGYAYDLTDGGWLAITAGQQIEPLLAYCESGRFPTQEEMPPAMEMMFDWYGEQIDAILHENYNSAESNSLIEQSAASATTIEPLLGDLSWGQSRATCWTDNSSCAEKIYNKFCPPANSEYNGRALVGCVAVAMAQIMRYWKWPHSAYISNSISSSGHPSNDKHWVEYDWDMMPDCIIQCSTPDSEVDMIAGLLRDCGYMAKMEYGATGSGAAETDARDALMDVFSYKETASRKLKSSYPNPNWKNMILAEIVEGRPVMYSGYKPVSMGSIGHEFVVDGYQGGSGLFHINWGWLGSSNGWYSLTNLRYDSNGDGDYTDENVNYTWGFSAVIGIEPDIQCDNYVRSGAIGNSYLVASTAGDIVCANTFSNGGIGLFYSGSQIRFLPGFHACSGSYIHAVIRDIDCSSTEFAAPALNTRGGVEELATESIGLSITPIVSSDVVCISGYTSSYTIYNAMGQLILSSNDATISVSGWHSGLYIICSGTQACKFFVY